MKNNEQKRFYVYVWYIVPTFEVIYVGKGSGNRASQLKGRNKFFIDMYNTHQCAYKIVLDGLEENIAFYIEKIMIAYFREMRPNSRLTNICDGGEGASGWIATEEYREKMRIKNLGSNNPNYHNWWPEEKKAALSYKLKKIGERAGAQNGNAKPVMCVETGVIYEYITDALVAYGIKNHCNMSVALRSPYRTAGGKHWVTGSMIETLSDENERIKYLSMYERRIPGRKNIICNETGEVFRGYQALSDALQVSKYRITKDMKEHNKYCYKGKTYTYQTNHQSPQEVTLAENLE